jgi:hypothetical protein
MKRLIAPLALAAVALAPGTALAHHSRAKVYRGTFDFVGADGDYVTGKFGHAQLVDGPRNDKLSVHVRRLAPNTKYVFRLQQAPKACEAGLRGGTDVRGWHYRNRGVLKTNRKGVANGKARSHRFRAKRDVEYFVGVYGLDGKIVLCAELNKKGGGKAGGKSEDKGGKKDKGRGKDKDRGKSKDRGKDKDRGGDSPGNGNANDSPGKSEDAPGQADDKQRGKSDEAPRGKGRDKDRGGNGGR